MHITSIYTFTQFDSVMLIDNGGSGYQLQDSLGNTIPIPTGVPITIAGQSGMAAGPIKIIAPVSGSLDVAAIFYS
jgi:hypothetical protein